MSLKASDAILQRLKCNFEELLEELREECLAEIHDYDTITLLQERLIDSMSQVKEQYTLLEASLDEATHLAHLTEQQELDKKFRNAIKVSKGLIREGEKASRAQELEHAAKLNELKSSINNLKLDDRNLDSQIAQIPKLELPEFSGVSSEFSAWLNTFQSIVDKHSISDALKLTYLRSCLDKASLGKITLFSIRDDDYFEAVKILKGAYGRDSVYKLINKLIGLPPFLCNYKEDIVRFHDEVDTILTSLKENGVKIEDSNATKIVLPILEGKVSGSIRDGWECLISAHEESIVTVKEFLKHISIAANFAESRGTPPSLLHSGMDASSQRETSVRRASTHTVAVPPTRGEMLRVILEEGSQILIAVIDLFVLCLVFARSVFCGVYEELWGTAINSGIKILNYLRKLLSGLQARPQSQRGRIQNMRRQN